ncbi:MAG TPA: dienelactone hydrolase family protein [Frankiaceae bacterium]|nr:dienelactone hydrolase family protein [Frankiaceae bacterium]
MSASPPAPAGSTDFPASGRHPIGVVVLPDIRGVAPFYEELCGRLAEHGHFAAVVDWYSHDAPLSRAQMQDDVMAAVHGLREGGCEAVVALGFCMGGRVAFLMSAERFGLAGVIGFYGAPGAVGPYDSGPTGLAQDLSAPILALFGEADEGITPQARDAFDEALTHAGVPHEIVTYPGAPHGFFDADQEGQEAACTDAWRRVLTFLNR